MMEPDAEISTQQSYHRVHFEEFRMYLESAERTTDRRLALNKSNASLSLLIMAGIGAIVSWSFGKDDVEPYAVTIIAAIALLAAIFCRWWLQQIVSYKELNAAKFEVLNEMASRIMFPDAGEESCFSHQPFAREWEILKKKKSLRPFKSGLALGASLSELTVPKTFIVSFSVIFVASVTIATLGRYDLVILKVFSGQ